MHGSVTRHGMTKHATPADPLLDIKVHGKKTSTSSATPEASVTQAFLPESFLLHAINVLE